MVMGFCLCRFCLNMKVVGDISFSQLAQGTTGCSEECCFGVKYGEWYGVCDLLYCRLLRYVLTMVV